MDATPAPLDTGSLSDPARASCAEAPLIQEAIDGSSRAFDDIVRIYHRRVYSYLYQMTRHHHDAEDLTQHTFIKAFQHLAGFNNERPLINWLLSIARNSAINHFRDSKKWEEMPTETASSEPSPARTFERKEQEANLWKRAREILPRREFEVLWFRFAEEMSIRETARTVGLTETHVKVLAFRARQTLLKGEYPQ